MKLQTKQFGELEFDEKLVISFTEGLLGFEDYNKFLLITEENGTFFWLNSVDEPELVFPLFPVGLIVEGFPDEKNCEIFGIVRLDRDPSKITINLKAPVYIDQEGKKGFQKIIDDDKYSIDYKLFIEN